MPIRFPVVRPAARLILALAVLSAAGAWAATEARTDKSRARDCFWQLEHGRADSIDCAYPAELSERERADLRKLTRDMLQDARCVVAIRIAREALTPVIAAETHVFEAPPQPVRCEIFTRDGTRTITGSFTPRVEIRDGRAVDATPGLGNIEGVPSYLAWPVVQYVNRSGAIRANVLEFVNAYRAHLAVRR